ncbi:AbrB/MazE/SpoVT family DNA-binding domain-containing protein [Candidatus Woesearchaeota archaeon]|nr:AbrB/MazE/SpoVT family DNA-binding domain-containing protein [Candidatus Woesearchaeota archaeon]
MKAAGTYKITRQGQITLPASIREALELEEGQVLDFFYSDATILIRTKREPIEVFRELAAEATKRFKERGVTREDIAKEIKAVRKAKHAAYSS